MKRRRSTLSIESGFSRRPSRSSRWAPLDVEALIWSDVKLGDVWMWLTSFADLGGETMDLGGETAFCCCCGKFALPWADWRAEQKSIHRSHYNRA
eukprot:gene15029-biopygen4132